MRTGEKAHEHRRRMDENRLTYKESAMPAMPALLLHATEVKTAFR